MKIQTFLRHLRIVWKRVFFVLFLVAFWASVLIIVTERTRTPSSVITRSSQLIVRQDLEIVSNSDFNKSILENELDRELEAAAVPITRLTQASPFEAVVLVMTDSNYIDSTINFNIYAKKANVTNVLAITTNKKTKEILMRNGIKAYHFMGHEDLGIEESEFMSKSFKRKAYIKLYIAVRLLTMGLSVLVSDADVVIMKDPFPYFSCDDCDIEAQNNYDFNGVSNELCAGFMFIRPTQRSLFFLEDFSEIREHSQYPSEQHHLNHNARSHDIKIRILDIDKFPTGRRFPFEHYFEPNAFRNVVVYHNNHVTNTIRKTYRARELGIWHVDRGMYYSDPRRKYVTYQHPEMTRKDDEIAALRGALSVAVLMKRTLILPKFRCPRTRTFQTLERPPNEVFCTLAEVLDISQFHTCYREWYREHTFLNHDKVPQSVRQSQFNIPYTKLLYESLKTHHFKSYSTLSSRNVDNNHIINAHISRTMTHTLQTIAVLKVKHLNGSLGLPDADDLLNNGKECKSMWTSLKDREPGVVDIDDLR